VGLLVRKHAHRDHAGPVVDLALERQRIGDLQAGHVQDVLAVVGDQRLAILQAQGRLAAQRGKLARNALRRHRNHLHRQRERAQHRYPFRFVRNADKTPGLRRHDLFARQGRATALDHVTLGVDFVGAIDVHRQFAHLVGIEHRNAVAAQALSGGHGAGHSPRNLVLDGGQCVDELVDGGTGAHAHNLARHHVLQRGLADQGFEFVLGQGGSAVHLGQSKGGGHVRPVLY
jgi:hypothetical protein